MMLHKGYCTEHSVKNHLLFVVIEPMMTEPNDRYKKVVL